MEKVYDLVANAENFHKELTENMGVAAKYVHMTLKGGKAYINISSALTTQEESDMDAIVASHDSDLVLPYFKIYDFLTGNAPEDKNQLPCNIDFKTMLHFALVKKTLPKDKGKPTAVEYYEKLVNGVYTNLVCRIDFTLTYDAGGFITEKIAMLKWYKTDDSMGMMGKNIGRVFDQVIDAEPRIKEGKQRRGSVVNGLQLPILAGLIESEATLVDETADEKQLRMILIGREFLTFHKVDFDNFIDHSDQAIVTTVTNDADPGHAFLDNTVTSWGGITIRAFILNELS